MAVHNCSEMVNSETASHIWVKGCLWKQLCGEQNRVHLWEVLLARWRLPFPERVSWSIEQRVVELVGGFQHLPSASGVYFVKFLSSSSAELHDSHLVDGLGWWFGRRVGYWSAVKQLVALVRRQEGSADLDHQAALVVLATLVYVFLEEVALWVQG